MDTYEFEKFCQRKYKEARRESGQLNALYFKSFIITFSIGLILIGVFS